MRDDHKENFRFGIVQCKSYVLPGRREFELDLVRKIVFPEVDGPGRAEYEELLKERLWSHWSTDGNTWSLEQNTEKMGVVIARDQNIGSDLIVHVENESRQNVSEFEKIAAQTRTIVKPPGSLAVSVLSKALPRKVYQQIVGQIVIDERDEYCDALQRGDLRQARWICIRIWLLITWSLVVSLPINAIERIRSQFVRK